MQTVTARIDSQEHATASRAVRQPQTLSGHVPAILASLIFVGLLLLWFSFDHHVPDADEAGHILNSVSYCDLLHHPHPLSAKFWHDFITVNQFYPPAAYIFTGALKLVFGSGRALDIATLAVFNVILSLSIFGTTKLLSKSNLAAILAVAIVNIYPECNFLSHLFWLDYPLVAMVSLGLFTLVFWSKAPSWPRALLCGLTLGLACMTKQIAAAYLALPGAYYVIFSLMAATRQEKAHPTLPDEASGRSAPLLQLIAIAALTALIALPWVLASAGETRALMNDCAAHVGKVALWQAFPRNATFYAGSLPHIMTPLLLLAWLFAPLALSSSTRTTLAPAALSALGGVAMVCTLTWIYPRPQYVAPALVAAAIYTACALCQMLTAQRRRAAAFATLILLLAATQYVCLQFTPYPIKTTHIEALASPLRNAELVTSPLAPEDWGQAWSLNLVEAHEKGAPVWLNILSNSPHINAHTFTLLAHELKVHIQPTTSRIYSIKGDRLRFSAKEALYYQWYLLNPNNAGHPFENAEAEAANQKLTDFVQKSGKFTLVAEQQLPDSTVMYLYRQKP